LKEKVDPFDYTEFGKIVKYEGSIYGIHADGVVIKPLPQGIYDYLARYTWPDGQQHSDASICEFTIYRDWIYCETCYEVNDAYDYCYDLFKCKIDGSETFLLAEGIDWVQCVSNGYLYYSDSEGSDLTRIDLSNDNKDHIGRWSRDGLRYCDGVCFYSFWAHDTRTERQCITSSTELEEFNADEFISRFPNWPLCYSGSCEEGPDYAIYSPYGEFTLGQKSDGIFYNSAGQIAAEPLYIDQASDCDRYYSSVLGYYDGKLFFTANSLEAWGYSPINDGSYCNTHLYSLDTDTGEVSWITSWYE